MLSRNKRATVMHSLLAGFKHAKEAIKLTKCDYHAGETSPHLQLGNCLLLWQFATLEAKRNITVQKSTKTALQRQLIK